MGMYDTISGNVNCPHCGFKQHTENQTKKLDRYFNNYEPGNLVNGGPYLNGEYPLYHQQTCKQCKKQFLHSFIIENQIITSLNTYKTETFEKKHFKIEATKDKLVEIIRQNCLTTILTSPKITEDYDFEAHWANFNHHMDTLLIYVQEFILNKYNYTIDLFITEVFNNLEDALTIEYIDLINIDFGKHLNLKVRENPLGNNYEEYDDLITHLKQVVSDKKEILKEQITDFFKYSNE